MLVNSAGIVADVPFLDTTSELFQKILNVNLFGAFLCSQQTARQMMQQEGGRIINIASISGQRGNKGRSVMGLRREV